MTIDSKRHSLLTESDVGTIVWQTVVDAGARLALSVNETHIGRIVRQTDDDSFWALVAIGPATYVELTSVGVAAVTSVFGRQGDVTAQAGDYTNAQVGLGNVENILNNLTATIDPTAGDDSDDGYQVGSTWINTAGPRVFALTDSTVGAAVWTELTGGGGGGGQVNTVRGTAPIGVDDIDPRNPIVEIDEFTGGAPGSVPQSVSNTTDFLRADGTWAVPALGDAVEGVTGTAPVTVDNTDPKNPVVGVSTFAAGVEGTVPDSPNNSTTYLRADGTWAVPPGGSGGQVDVVTGTAPIAVDSTDPTAPDVSIAEFAGSTPGAVPTSVGGTTTYLRADGTWNTPPGGSGGQVDVVVGAIPVTVDSSDPTAPLVGVTDFTPAQRGTVPASGGGTVNFLRADGTWATPPAGGSVAWGDITGTLSNQTDLQNALNAKAASTDPRFLADQAERESVQGMTDNTTWAGGVPGSDPTFGYTKAIYSGVVEVVGDLAVSTINGVAYPDPNAGQVDSVTGTAPISVDSTDPSAPDVSVGTFTGAATGVVPVGPNNTTDFLRADGTWAPPPQTVSGIGVWTYEGTGTPSAGQFTITNPGAGATIRIHDDRENGQNAGVLLLLYRTGTIFYAQNADGTGEVAYDVTSDAVEVGDVTEFTADLRDSASWPPGTGSKCNLFQSGGGGGGGGGQVNTVTGTLPITVDSADPINPDVRINTFTGTAAPGAVPGSTGSTTEYLRADGTWQEPDATPVEAIAGLGLVGSGSTQLDVGSGTGITVNANNIEINMAEIDHDMLVNHREDKHRRFVHDTSANRANYSDSGTGEFLVKNGDYYLETDTIQFYYYSTGWVQVVTGSGGTTVLTGTSNPAAGLGNTGDLYFQQTTETLWFKDAGTWKRCDVPTDGITLQRTGDNIEFVPFDQYTAINPGALTTDDEVLIYRTGVGWRRYKANSLGGSQGFETATNTFMLDLSGGGFQDIANAFNVTLDSGLWLVQFNATYQLKTAPGTVQFQVGYNGTTSGSPVGSIRVHNVANAGDLFNVHWMAPCSVTTDGTVVRPQAAISGGGALNLGSGLGQILTAQQIS